MSKIIKNTTGSDIALTELGITIPSSNQTTVNLEDYLILSTPDSVTELTTLINAGNIVINDGTLDLPADVGIAHIQNINGVVRNHSDITLLPAVTTNAPEVIKLSNANIGFSMQETDEIFGQSRLNNYAGGDVEVQIHMAIDNEVADRWVQFDVHYITTNGINDKAMNSVNGTLQMGPDEVPSSPAYRIFESLVTVPASAFENGEKYIYIGIERVTATGKTAPVNNPVVLRYCKRYWEVLES